MLMQNNPNARSILKKIQNSRLFPILNVNLLFFIRLSLVTQNITRRLHTHMQEEYDVSENAIKKILDTNIDSLAYEFMSFSDVTEATYETVEFLISHPYATINTIFNQLLDNYHFRPQFIKIEDLIKICGMDIIQFVLPLKIDEMGMSGLFCLFKNAPFFCYSELFFMNPINTFDIFAEALQNSQNQNLVALVQSNVHLNSAQKKLISDYSQRWIFLLNPEEFIKKNLLVAVNFILNSVPTNIDEINRHNQWLHLIEIVINFINTLPLVQRPGSILDNLHLLAGLINYSLYVNTPSQNQVFPDLVESKISIPTIQLCEQAINHWLNIRDVSTISDTINLLIALNLANAADYNQSSNPNPEQHEMMYLHALVHCHQALMHGDPSAKFLFRRLMEQITWLVTNEMPVDEKEGSLDASEQKQSCLTHQGLFENRLKDNTLKICHKLIDLLQADFVELEKNTKDNPIFNDLFTLFQKLKNMLQVKLEKKDTSSEDLQLVFESLVYHINIVQKKLAPNAKVLLGILDTIEDKLNHYLPIINSFSCQYQNILNYDKESLNNLVHKIDVHIESLKVLTQQLLNSSWRDLGLLLHPDDKKDFGIWLIEASKFWLMQLLNIKENLIPII